MRQPRIEATKQGSSERVALVRKFYEDSKLFFGGDQVDKVKEAHRQLVAEERQHGEELKRQAQKNASDLVAATREKASEIMAQEGVSKAQQLAQVRDLYAQELLSATLTKEKRVEVERSLNEAIAAVHREASSTRQAIARSDAETGIAIARLNVAAEKQILDEQLAAHQINAAQKFAILQNLETREEALNEKALQDERASLSQEPAAVEKINNQILELRAKLNLDLAALDRQRAAEVKKELQQENAAWKSTVGEIENAESTMLSDLLSKRKSFGASALAVAGTLVQQEIANDVRAFTTKLLLSDKEKALEQGGLAYHAVAELQKTLATRTAVAARTVAEESGANGWLNRLGHLVASWFGRGNRENRRDHRRGCNTYAARDRGGYQGSRGSENNSAQRNQFLCRGRRRGRRRLGRRDPDLWLGHGGADGGRDLRGIGSLCGGLKFRSRRLESSA